ncbi:hypothetical protein [Curvivirga sp.]|uniref:hypothetical protein n=1 Tax=Curvivirga sp. TaxID=2856848 RepID=UPI003B5B0771
MYNRLKRIISNPEESYYNYLARQPMKLFAQNSKLATRQGFDDVKFVLSFDCDTPEDIEVAIEVHNTLKQIGVLPVYAVPCELIQQGLDVYSEIRDSGAEFINHGYRSHTYWDEKAAEYKSNFFYDQQDRALLVEDITKGHQYLTQFLGEEPKGFRTPHFGTFQKKEELGFLYSTLRDLGVSYSSSTLPKNGFKYGPMYLDRGIYEFPVTGRVNDPLLILDSWAFFASPTRQSSPKEYLSEIKKMTDIYSQNGTGLINIYADPCHIAGQDNFFAAIQLLAEKFQSTSYRNLIEVS